MNEETMNAPSNGFGSARSVQELLHYWFVQYNPLYFFSALCVLAGMLLLSRGLTEMDWQEGQLLLSGVMQLYEIILIAGAALLFRTPGQRRPAVILGLVEIFFLLDGTLRTELMTTLGGRGLVASGGWVVMVALKLWAMAWAFRLRISAWAFFLPCLAALGVALFPHALAATDSGKGLVHLMAVWYGLGLALCAKFLKPRVECTIMLDSWGHQVLWRSTKACWGIWAGFYLLHLWVWTEMFRIPFSAAQAAPFMLVLFLLRKEVWAWAAGPVIIALSATFPPAVIPAAFIVGIFYGLKGRQERRPRFFTGAVVYVYIGLWCIGWEGGALPDPNLWLNGAAILVLLGMAWIKRLPSAIAGAVLIMLTGAEAFVPSGRLQWGSFIMVMGFTTLLAGIATDLWYKKGKAT